MTVSAETRGALMSRSLVAVIASITVTGIGLGATGPLLSLLMNDMGWPRTLIGINTAMPAIAAMVSSPVLLVLLRRFKLIPVIQLSLALVLAALLAFRFLPEFWAWLIIRFVLGLGLSLVFIATELWINLLADEKNRGKLVGIYGTCLAAGLVAGAGLLTLTGIRGWLPVLAAGVPFVIAAVLLSMLRISSPVVQQDDVPDRFLPFIPLAPIAMGSALIFGAVEMGILSLMPVYFVRSGLTETEATVVVMVGITGNLLSQVPIGMLADRLDRRLVMLLCTGGALVIAVLIPFVVDIRLLLYPLIFLLGAVALGIYTVGLTMLGERFSGSHLVGANAAFVFMYGIGSLLGPPGGGGAMDLWDPHGLMVVLGFLTAIHVGMIAGTLVFSRMRVSERSPE